MCSCFSVLLLSSVCTGRIVSSHWFATGLRPAVCGKVTWIVSYLNADRIQPNLFYFISCGNVTFLNVWNGTLNQLLLYIKLLFLWWKMLLVGFWFMHGLSPISSVLILKIKLILIWFADQHCCFCWSKKSLRDFSLHFSFFIIIILFIMIEWLIIFQSTKPWCVWLSYTLLEQIVK